ncbi:MAG: 6,7-dimethyl-8-ribityllumazine synthase [Methyloligellaceae bacterium]
MSQPQILILIADYYEEICSQLETGACRALERKGIGYKIERVPGALEIPTALALAINADKFSGDSASRAFSGCVALGCVIRGETSHYDIVANQSAGFLLELATKHGIPVGNGILTVDNRDQAIERAHPDKRDKGGDAAQACLALMALSDRFDDT